MTNEEMESRHMIVPATQFLRPYGERQKGGFYTTPEVFALAEEVIAKGYRFEIELLTTGLVHVDVCGPIDGEDGVVTNMLSPNSPELMAKFDDLVRRAHARIKRRAA